MASGAVEEQLMVIYIKWNRVYERRNLRKSQSQLSVSEDQAQIKIHPPISIEGLFVVAIEVLERLFEGRGEETNGDEK